MGEFSRIVRINLTDSTPPGQFNSSMLIDFNFQALCQVPTMSLLEWRLLTFSEVLSYIIAILDEEQTTAKISIELVDLNVIVYHLDGLDAFRVQIASSNETILKENSYSIRNLRPQSNYSFTLELDLEYESGDQSNRKPFKLISETIECRTPSIEEAFGTQLLEIKGKTKTF